MSTFGKLLSGLLLAAVVGGGTYFGYTVWDNDRKQLVEVLTVSQEIPPRTQITQKMFDDGIIKVSKHPVSVVPPNVFQKPEEVIGKFTVSNYTAPKYSYLYKGKVLSAEEMKDGAAMLLKPGERMVSINVNLKSSLAAQITENSYVDLWIMAESKEDRAPVVGPFLEKVRVIGTYSSSNQKSRPTSDTPADPNEPPKIGVNLVPQTILLAVSNEQLFYINLAEKLGQISISGVGYEEMNTAPNSTNDQMGEWSISHTQAWMKSRLSKTFQGANNNG
ncbi:Flp pilus assembly protein CpaB [Brevibacillus aydinogluensis]|jgi:Flp pilus assembly protein CpaB|uniref:Flp pilus assembly protein CpaB n=1 Tax=Brevibacillus aydinogluensis TaxID=927786 RepID=UPI002892C4FC|nr:Flp pilus assembly protein CpaB [Brevibacillus aydinogluensis]MDT3417168.1 Flp pilus assembly protein CpaB [Brevibacillus aydinogluensis]